MKGKHYNLLKLKGLEDKNSSCRQQATIGVNSGSGNHFFVVGQEEQSPEQAGAAGVSFLGTSFLADSL